MREELALPKRTDGNMQRTGTQKWIVLPVTHFKAITIIGLVGWDECQTLEVHVVDDHLFCALEDKDVSSLC